MDKSVLLAQVVAQLETELAKAKEAARAAVEAATAEENRPENQYDTRALEASFLARGQANRVAELELAIQVLRQLPLKPVATDAPIQAGALIKLDVDGTEQTQFVLPAGAGLQASAGKEKVAVVTTSSPLGQMLLGKCAGDSFTFRHGPTTKEFEILRVE